MPVPLGMASQPVGVTANVGDTGLANKSREIAGSNGPCGDGVAASWSLIRILPSRCF